MRLVPRWISYENLMVLGGLLLRRDEVCSLVLSQPKTRNKVRLLRKKSEHRSCGKSLLWFCRVIIKWILG